MIAMKKKFVFSIVVIGSLYGYETSELSVFNTPLPGEKAVIKKDCWVVCKKRITEIEKIHKALEYYKTSRYYSFERKRSK